MVLPPREWLYNNVMSRQGCTRSCMAVRQRCIHESPFSCGACCPGEWLWVDKLIPTVRMESQHSIGTPTCHDFPRFVIISEKSQPEVGNRWRWSLFFGEKDPLRANFQKIIPQGFTNSQNHVLCANFVKFGWPEISKVVRCLPDKKNKNSARSPALASARMVPKICQGQLQTIYSEFPKFHPNPFTSGGVIAEHMNIVETHHKVFPIIGETSSPSNNTCIYRSNQKKHCAICIYMTCQACVKFAISWKVIFQMSNNNKWTDVVWSLLSICLL